MKKISLKKLVQDKVVTNISGLRANMNGYPYVTMLVAGADGKTESQNVYFGKKTATVVMDTFSEGDNIIPFLANAEVIQTQTRQEGHKGEIRFKLSTSGESDYASEVELADVFDLDLQAGDFDVALFRKGFASKDAAVKAGATEGVTG